MAHFQGLGFFAENVKLKDEGLARVPTFKTRRVRGSDSRLVRRWIQLRMLERSTKYAGRSRRLRSAYWYELHCRFADAASPGKRNICDLVPRPKRSCGTCTPGRSVASGPWKRLPAKYPDDRS